jgi:hypothetical protein
LDAIWRLQAADDEGLSALGDSPHARAFTHEEDESGRLLLQCVLLAELRQNSQSSSSVSTALPMTYDEPEPGHRELLDGAGVREPGGSVD